MAKRNGNGRVTALIAGGGVAALEAALALRAHGDGLVRAEVLAPEPRFWYRPAATGEPFGRSRTPSLDLSDLVARAGATLTLGELAAVDHRNHVVRTTGGAELAYDALLLACGAAPEAAIGGALTFRGPADTSGVEHLLGELERGEARRVVFAVPPGAVWSLPLYELALLTAWWTLDRRLDVELVLATPEDRPLALFGRQASDSVAALLRERNVQVRTRTYAVEAREGVLTTLPEGEIPADRVVALPRLRGPSIDGVPQTHDGFVPVDRSCRVRGLADVFAAGDVTSFPVKQGGIAAQQADAAAETIAAEAGAPIVPRPFRPVLRGLLLTGSEPRFLRHDPVGSGETAGLSVEPLWWPPAKIVGRHLAPFLGALDPELLRPPEQAIEVEVDVSEPAAAPPRARPAAQGQRRVRELAISAPTVAADAPLADVAAELLAQDADAAVVEDGREVVGLLTVGDLLRAARARISTADARAREWMTAEPPFVDADASVEDAALLLAQTGGWRLVVLDHGRPTGVVSASALALVGR